MLRLGRAHSTGRITEVIRIVNFAPPIRRSDLLREPKLPKQITMNMMLSLQVLKFEDDFEELSAAAQKENTLKNSLKNMKEDWVPICLDTMEYKDTGAHMLRGIDDVQAILDDHIVKVQSMRGCAGVGPLALKRKVLPCPGTPMRATKRPVLFSHTPM